MNKSIFLFFLFPFSFCFGTETVKVCSSQDAKQAVVTRLNTIYGHNYLARPLIVRSDGDFWDVCSKRNITPSKIVHVKVTKASKTCEIKTITHYEDSVVVNTGNTQSFIAMKKEIECNPEGTISVRTSHPNPYSKSDFKCSNYGLKDGSELCAKLKFYNDR